MPTFGIPYWTKLSGLFVHGPYFFVRRSGTVDEYHKCWCPWRLVANQTAQFAICHRNVPVNSLVKSRSDVGIPPRNTIPGAKQLSYDFPRWCNQSTGANNYVCVKHSCPYRVTGWPSPHVNWIMVLGFHRNVVHFMSNHFAPLAFLP